MTSEVIDSAVSVVFDQAENRLHTQKALLSMLSMTRMNRPREALARIPERRIPREAWLAHYDRDVRTRWFPIGSHARRLPVKLGREHADKTALLFKGTLCPMASSMQRALRRGAVEPRCSQGRPRGAIAAQLSAVPGSRSSAPGRSVLVVGVNPTYTERELEQMLDALRAQTIVTLTPFYDRVKRVQGRVGLRHVIATSIKEYLPPVLRLLFTVFKERKEGHRIHLASGDHWMGQLLRAHSGSRDRRSSVPHDQAVILSSGGTTGTPKGVVGFTDTTSPRDAKRTSGRSRQKAMGGRDHAAAAAVSCTPTSVFSRWRSWTEPNLARSKSARHRRPAEDDSIGQAGVLQRRADVVPRS